MKHQNVVCIDLGSAYTKVGVRTGWDSNAILAQGFPLAEQRGFCIPSVVARGRRGAGYRWAVGSKAANQPAGEGVTVYRNWKAQFFAEDSAALGGQIEGAPSTAEIHEVAVRFFRGLKEAAELAKLGIDLATCSTRVCIPKLPNTAAAQERLAAVIREAGWYASADPTLFEPESNAWGVLTRGRNVTWRPQNVSYQPSVGRQPRLSSMIADQDLFASLERVSGSYGILLVDIGAFTTDFAFVNLDTSFRSDNWYRPTIIQESLALGVRELDEAVLARLNPHSQQAIRSLSPAIWDQHKEKLYAGGKVMVRHPEGGSVTLGDGQDANAITGAIREFSERVIRARNEFCRRYVSERIDAEFLTGGGSMIAGIRRAVDAAAPRGRRMVDLHSAHFGGRIVNAENRVGAERSRELDAIERRMLLRGGSAVGGCSVLLN